MNILQKIILFCFFAALMGCSNEFKFEEDFINHFPKMKSEMVYYEYTMNLPNEFKQYGANKKEVYKYKGAIKYFVETLVNSSKTKVSYDDSCVIVLPVRYSKNIDIGKPNINSRLHDSSVVIPNISEMSDYLTFESSDFVFYILENKAGEYLEKQDLFTDNIMPRPWTNGYTKGVAINQTQELVMFWIDIW